MSVVVISIARMKDVVCGKYDDNYKNYGNAIEGELVSMSDAMDIIKNGNKTKVYNICLPIDSSISLNNFNDVGNGYYVYARYCFVGGIWVRMCITKNKSYEYSKRNGYMRMS